MCQHTHMLHIQAFICFDCLFLGLFFANCIVLCGFFHQLTRKTSPSDKVSIYTDFFFATLTNFYCITILKFWFFWSVCCSPFFAMKDDQNFRWYFNENKTDLCQEKLIYLDNIFFFSLWSVTIRSMQSKMELIREWKKKIGAKIRMWTRQTSECYWGYCTRCWKC